MVKIIAISGSGRSGSTLLSLLLSQDARVFNLGQLRHLWRSYEDNEPCSCSQSLQSCEIYADIVVDTLQEERFHVLPHPEVEEYVRRKGNDIDRWISGMQRLRRRSQSH